MKTFSPPMSVQDLSGMYPAMLNINKRLHGLDVSLTTNLEICLNSEKEDIKKLPTTIIIFNGPPPLFIHKLGLLGMY